MIKKLPGIYIHLPFCSVHCIYCDFPLTTRLSLSPRYYQALVEEIRRHPPDQPGDTLYFGGGTPSLAPVEVLREIIGMMDLAPDAELTLEVNPDHVTPAILNEWRNAGMNRLSLGIQSLETQVLEMMLRQHSPEQAVGNLRAVHESGFDNVNVDLMLGFPKQTAPAFIADLDRLIGLHPEHFSIYLLELHEATALYKMVQKDQASVMPEEDQLQCFEKAVELLKNAGYEHYEVSNFALPGKESRHNLKYWTDVPYFAYGAGACSYIGSTRTKNYQDIVSYIEAIEEARAPHEELISETSDIRARNALIFGLRKTQGIDTQDFESAYGCEPRDLFGESLEEYIADGLLEMSHGQLRFTAKGLLLSNEILSSAI